MVTRDLDAPGHKPPLSPVSQQQVPGEIWIMVAAAFAVAVGFGLIAPVMPHFAASFNVSVTQVTIIITSFAAFRVLFAPAAGMLVNRFRERWIYITGLIIVAISTLLIATADSYWLLLAYRSFGGIGSVMFTVSAAGLIVRLSPPDLRGRVSSYYGGAFVVGNVIGPLIGGILAEIAMWVPFVVYGVALLIAAAVVAIFLSASRLRSYPVDDKLPPLRIGDTLRDSAYRAVIGSGFANGWIVFGIRIAVLPLFASTIVAGEWVAGLVLSVFAFGNASILLFAGRLTDRVGRRLPIMVGNIVLGSAFIAIGFSTNLVMLISCAALAGMGAATANPAAQAVLADIIGPKRAGGKVIATYMQLVDIGAVIGPVITGLLVDTVGYQWGFLLSGSLAVLAGVHWITGRETAPFLTQR
ncbi:MAG: MFS transporter [Bowdeniella nasicola]|nr:MFS transporter [Bowdeniella nasicola]